MSQLADHRIIVMGASRGGTNPLTTIMADLPGDLPAALIIVRHIGSDSTGYIEQILDRAGPLPICLAQDGTRIVPGCIYVAVADHHLLVGEGHLLVTRGPRENRFRPAIDPLFRSAAVAYGSRVVAVLLSGLLSDGAAGLAAVQRCGGITIVQDPDDASSPDLPRNALAQVEVDHVLPAAEIGKLLVRLVREPVPESAAPAPAGLVIETRIAEHATYDLEDENLALTPQPYGCPECGGPLWKMEGDPVKRFRCRVGHGYTAEALVEGMTETAESSLWAAMRSFEERAEVLQGLGRESSERGREQIAARYHEREQRARRHAGELRNLLLGPEERDPASAAEPAADPSPSS